MSIIEKMKIAEQILRKAERGTASLAYLTCFYINKDEIYLEWMREQEIHIHGEATPNELLVKFVMNSEARKAPVFRKFSTKRLKLLVLKATIQTILAREEETIQNVAATKIQSMPRRIAEANKIAQKIMPRQSQKQLISARIEHSVQ